jgi:hypothetical protein
MMAGQTHWLELCRQLLWDIVRLGLQTIEELDLGDFNLETIPHCALLHLSSCLQASAHANEKGEHAIAVCLIRQCIEALTLIEVGLQQKDYACPLLEKWRDGKKSHGNLRASLEKHVWPRYGNGLWDEPWSEFFSNLARAVQPYAHYTYELMLWQFKVLRGQDDAEGGLTFTATWNPRVYDSRKGSQLALLQGLVGWTLGRLLLENRKTPQVSDYSERIRVFGEALSESEWLDKQSDWPTNLLPVVLMEEEFNLSTSSR